MDGVVFVRSDAGDAHVMLPHGKTLCKPKEYPWLGEDGQKLPLVLCIEDCKKKKNQKIVKVMLQVVQKVVGKGK